jgi:hypothetical protein
MTGRALICKLGELQPIEGADRIAQVTMFGETVIVSKDHFEGQVGLLFDCETQLSHEYASANNLYRHSNLNEDQSKSGYLDDNRRIRPIQLKGVKCSAMWMPLSSVYNLDTKIPNLNIGQEIEEINGVPICSKYVTQKTKQNSTKPKEGRVSLKDKVPTFKEHLDTDQWGRNSHKVKEGDLVIITEKLHGCFPNNTKIYMADNSVKKINKVQIGDYVWGYDIKENKNVKTKVLNIWNKKHDKKWIKIKWNKTGMGDYPTTVSTLDHKFYTTNRGYVSAQELTEQDRVLMLSKTLEINEIQKSVLIGKMLGDGHIDTHSKNYSVVFGHKEEHKDYILYCNKLLGDLSTQNIRYRTSGYGTTMLDSRTLHTPNITSFCSKWLNNTIDETTKLNPLILAIWYMDDGSLSHSDAQQDRACFAICSYDDEQVKTIEKLIYDYGFRNYTFYKSDGYNRLRLNYKDADILFRDIKEYIPVVMQYKLPEKYRTRVEPNIEYQRSNELLVPLESTIFSKELYESSGRKYDFETETNNFYANKVLVHNSSIRTANLPVLRTKPWYEKFFNKLGLNTKDYEYQFVIGSRRVVKSIGGNEAENKAHFYDEDLWTTIAKREFEGKLRKGETIYGEIVGYTPSGESIMGSHSNSKLKNFMSKNEYKEFINKYGETTEFSYGCSNYVQPQTKSYIVDDTKEGFPNPSIVNYPNFEKTINNKVFIYRITMTNEDGESIDLSWEQVKTRSEQLGVAHVPELYVDFPYNPKADPPEKNERILNHLVENFTESDSKNFPQHINEGVCVRIENGSLTPQIYKSKRFYFRVLEGLIKDDSNSIDIEESN